MVRDVSTCWNSTTSMLEQALQLWEALKLLVVMEPHNCAQDAQLARFKLSKDEWDLLAQLFPVLDVSLMIAEHWKLVNSLIITGLP